MDHQLIDAAAYTLAVWGLEDHQERLLADHDGLALLALLCNQAAKLAEARGEHERAQRLYVAKPVLLRAALTAPSAVWWAAPHGWGHGSVALFIEVAEPVGQIAFHITGDEPELRDLLEDAPGADGRLLGWLAQTGSRGRADAPVAHAP